MFKILLLALYLTSYYVNCEPIVKKTKVQFPPDVSALIRKGIDLCKKEGDDIPTYINMIYTGTFTEEERFRKFMECLIQTNGYADSKGKFIVEKVVTVYPDQKKMTDIINQCNKQTADTVTKEPTFETFKCFQKELPYEIYF